MAIGAAIQRPVVKHREFAVGGRMNVEFDDVGTRGEAGLHRGNRVLQIVVAGRQHSRGRACVVLQLAFVEALGDAAMREQHRRALAMCGETIGVVDIDGGEDDDG